MDGICGYLINLLPNRITEVQLSNLKSRDLKHSQNSLLASLPEATYRRIEERSERVELDYGRLIYKAGSVIRQIYFPESGIISLLATVDERQTLEVGIVGSEGMIGLPAFLGVKSSDNAAVVQGQGFALKMPTKDFLAECRASEIFDRVLKTFAQSLMAQTSQSAACNRFHTVESRMARWLLMTSDRMKSGVFQITQEFFSNMVGVRREAININARNLQKRGAISYIRGTLTIVDPKLLKTISCSCYALILKHRPVYKTAAI